MLNKFRVFLFLTIFFGLIRPIYSANHYVDKYANGNNNGSTWANAWESFGSINWGVINPGDNIYISGGNDSTVYNETLTVSKSGTSGNRITILAGIESGHNGKVVINGQGSRAYGIFIFNASYVAVKNITLRKTTQGLITISHGNYCFINSCKLYVYGRAGVFVQYSTGSEVRYNRIETGSYVNCQTDGIYSQYTNSNIYDHNYIVVNNAEPTGHDDCIQSFKDKDLSVYSNYLEQHNSKTSNAQGLYATTPTGGTFKYYNNVVNMGNAQSNGMSFRRLNGTGTVKIIGNTLYGKKTYSLLYVTETADPVIKNNIIYSEYNTLAARLVNWNGNKSNVDYNLIYIPNSSCLWSLNGNGYNWSQWRGLGFDTHGKNTNPQLKSVSNKDFSLSQNSPAINVGITMGSPFDCDYTGLSRPQGANFDMGAYELSTNLSNPGGGIHASISNATTVVVNFFGTLDQSSAQDPSNYNINNGITVNSAVVSADGNNVILTTSPHSSGQNYIVTVNNVTDMAGNISPEPKSADYSFVTDNNDSSPNHVNKVEQGVNTPSEFKLEQNYPNPFNPTTTINFNIPSDQQIKIDIYNTLGQLVTTLVNKFYSAGTYNVTFNASNLPSGVYIYRLESKSFTDTKKMNLIK